MGIRDPKGSRRLEETIYHHQLPTFVSSDRKHHFDGLFGMGKQGVGRHSRIDIMKHTKNKWVVNFYNNPLEHGHIILDGDNQHTDSLDTPFWMTIMNTPLPWSQTFVLRSSTNRRLGDKHLDDDHQRTAALATNIWMTIMIAPLPWPQQFG